MSAAVEPVSVTRQVLPAVRWANSTPLPALDPLRTAACCQGVAPSAGPSRTSASQRAPLAAESKVTSTSIAKFSRFSPNMILASSPVPSPTRAPSSMLQSPAITFHSAGMMPESKDSARKTRSSTGSSADAGAGGLAKAVAGRSAPVSAAVATQTAPMRAARERRMVMVFPSEGGEFGLGEGPVALLLKKEPKTRSCTGVVVRIASRRRSGDAG